MHELLLDPSWRLPRRDDDVAVDVASEPRTPAEAAAVVERRLRRAMEDQFWKSLEDSLLDVAPSRAEDGTSTGADTFAFADVSRAVALTTELRDELASLCPPRARTADERDLLERALTPENVRDALTPAPNDPIAAGAALASIHDAAAAMLRRMGAPARDDEAEARADAKTAELRERFAAAAAAAAARDARAAARAVAAAVTSSLSFLHRELRDLRRDVANAGVLALEPLARGVGGARYARERFAARFGAPTRDELEDAFREEGAINVPGACEGVKDALPRTRAWITRGLSRAHALDASLAAATAAASTPLPMRTGGRSSAADAAADADDDDRRRIASSWTPAMPVSPRGLLRVALALLVSKCSRLSEESLPETLEFDGDRITAAQEAFQKITVMCACVSIANDAKANAKSHAPSLESLRRRLDALLNDGGVRLADLALELATFTTPSPATAEDGTSSVAASAAAHEASLRRLTSEDDPDAVGLREAVRDALCARLLLGPDAGGGGGGARFRLRGLARRGRARARDRARDRPRDVGRPRLVLQSAHDRNPRGGGRAVDTSDVGIETRRADV